MAPPCNPLRTQCEEFVRAEIARLGVAGVDTAAVVRRFVELGAARSRVHAWVTAMKREAGPPPVIDLVAQEAAAFEESAQLASLAMAAELGAVLDSLPAPEALAVVADLVAEVAADVDAALAAPLASVEAAPSAAPAAAPADPVNDAGASVVPAEARAVLDQLETIMATCNKVLLASLGADGKVRNARQALNAVEALRRCLETSLKLYESVSNVQQIETFMAEMLAEVRPLAPELAQAVIGRMRRVQTRWSRVETRAPAVLLAA